MFSKKILSIPEHHVIGSVDQQSNVVSKSLFTKGVQLSVFIKKPGAGSAGISSLPGSAETMYPIQVISMAEGTPACAQLPVRGFDLYDAQSNLIASQASIDNAICRMEQHTTNSVYWVV